MGAKTFMLLWECGTELIWPSNICGLGKRKVNKNLLFRVRCGTVIILFSKYLLNGHCIPGSGLGAGNSKMNVQPFPSRSSWSSKINNYCI